LVVGRTWIEQMVFHLPVQEGHTGSINDSPTAVPLL
jgi:hypothetical protein